MTRKTGGQIVLDRLGVHGVDLVFGVISIHTLDLFDALYDRQQTVRHLGGRTELACGFMADGYARSSGRPGVVVTSSGPGAANSIHSMGEAYHSSSPVLQITTNVEREYLDRTLGITHEPKEQLQMFRSVTDWNSLIEDLDSIPGRIDEAFVRFKTRRPRPIELEIPTDLLGETAEVTSLQAPGIEPPGATAAQVEKVLQEIRRSQRPLIWAGEEISSSGGTEELIRLAETLGAPVVTADGGKDAFPEDHPLSLGTALGERIWGSNPVHEFIGNCDLVLAFGAALPYRTTLGIGIEIRGRLVQVVLDPGYLGRNYPVSVGIAANSKVVANQLLDALGDNEYTKGEAYLAEARDLRKQAEKDLRKQWPNEVRAMEAIRSVLPRETITCWDTTVPTSRASRAFRVFRPRTFMNPYGWVGIGFSFPAALGAKAANPTTPVVCFSGDGGFQYCLSELATAAQYNLNVTVVMFNDNAWGVLKGFQKRRFDGRFIGTELLNPDFTKLVDAYGFSGKRVDTVKELVPALEEAIAAPELTFIEVRIPRGLGGLR